MFYVFVCGNGYTCLYVSIGIQWQFMWKHTCGCVSSVCADITIVVVLCILSSWSTGDFGGWLIIRSAFALLSDTCVPKANDSAARTMSRTWRTAFKCQKEQNRTTLTLENHISILFVMSDDDDDDVVDHFIIVQKKIKILSQLMVCSSHFRFAKLTFSCGCCCCTLNCCSLNCLIPTHM